MQTPQSRLTLLHTWQIAFPAVTICNQNRINCGLLGEITDICLDMKNNCTSLELIVNTSSKIYHGTIQDLCVQVSDDCLKLWTLRDSSCLDDPGSQTAPNKTEFNSEANFLSFYMAVSYLLVMFIT